jgi:uncharacterized membrane protein YuzA (DUF378 family)
VDTRTLYLDNTWTTNTPSVSLEESASLHLLRFSMKKLDVVAAALLVIGGLNWGLVGTVGVDLVATLFGPMSPLARTVYVLVGLAGLYQAMQWQGIQRRWLAPARTARA